MLYRLSSAYCEKLRLLQKDFVCFRDCCVHTIELDYGVNYFVF